MIDEKKANKILSEYERQADEVIAKMTKILLRAQKKADNRGYRKALKSLKVN